MELWHPRAKKVIPNSYTGSLLTRFEKQVLHSTESDFYVPSSASYFGHQLWPTATLGRVKNVGWELYQHLPLNRMSSAMRNLAGGVETNRDGCIQIEITGRAATSIPNLPNEALDILFDWLWFVHEETGIPYEFVDDFHHYPPENGYRLGKEPWRLRGAEWDSYRGILGHQHADENVHGDPGKIDIDYLKAKRPTTPVPPVGGSVSGKGNGMFSTVIGPNNRIYEACIGTDQRVYTRSGDDIIKLVSSDFAVLGDIKAKSINCYFHNGNFVVAVQGLDNKFWYNIFIGAEFRWNGWVQSAKGTMFNQNMP